jgi:ABC-type glycerol-3-phosphate transport system substrate-binding protein
MNPKPKLLDRRKFIYAGLGAITIIALGTAAYFATRPPQVVEKTVATTIEKTVEKPIEKVITTTVEKPVEKTIVTTVAGTPTTIVKTEVKKETIITTQTIEKPVEKTVEKTIVTTVTPTKPVAIMHKWGGTEGEVFEKILKDFDKERPELEIKIVFVPTDPREVVMPMIAAGKPPDVVQTTMPAWIEEMAKAGALLPLDDLWKEKGYDRYFSESWKEMVSVEGRIYAVPVKADEKSCIWYTIKEFKELGLEEPKTWDEFIALCEKAKKAGKYPLIIGAKDGWVCTDTFENILVKLDPDKYMKLAKHEISWEDPIVYEVFEYWKQLLPYYYPNPLGYGFYEAFLKRTRGEAMMQSMGDWIDPMTIAEFGWKPGVDFTFFTWPIINPNVPHTIIVGADFFTLLKGENPKHGRILIDFLASDKCQTLLAKSGWMVPNKLVPKEIFNPNMKKVAEDLAKYNVVFDLDDLLPTELSRHFRSQLQRFFKEPDKYKEICASLEAKAKEVYK